MPKLTTERIIMDGSIKNELDFKYDINVSKDGVFSTMIPKDIAELFKNANIDLAKNRRYNSGYVSADTIDELKQEVKNICLEYLSRELISEILILKYGIETRASYCLGTDGEIYPNGRYPNALIKDTHNSYANWKNGTISINASSPNNLGLLVYVQAFKKQTYKYKSGTKKEELISIWGDENSGDAILDWICNLTCINPNKLKIQEIEYTPEIGLVFINMIKSICLLNEKIKDFLEPDGIRLIANSEIKRLM